MYSVFQMQLSPSPPWILDWWSWLVAFWRPMELLCFLTVVVMSLVGLLAIWCGLGRGNWFLRAAVVLGCISLLLVIPAYELVVVYLLQAWLTTIALTAWRHWRLSRATCDTVGRPCRNAVPWQFSIRDLLLFTVLVACASAMLAKAPATVWSQWPALLVEGLILAWLTIAAAWIALGRGHWWARLPVLLLLLPSLPSALMVAWLLLWRWARSAGTALKRSFWRIGISRAALLLLSLVILAPATAVYWRLTHPRPIPATVVPDPNGYDDLIRAGKLLSAVTAPDFDTVTEAQLKAYVAQCSGVYAPVRAALAKPCRASLRWEDKDLKGWFSDADTLRATSRAFYGQGRLAALEGRTADAVAAYLAVIRLGQASQRGGLLSDLLVGLTCESIGHHGFAEVRKSLSANDCKAILPTLRELFSEPPPLEECLARDAAWDDRAYGWQGRFMAMLIEITGDQDTRQNAAFICERYAAKRRLLICDLAIRAYSLEHGRNPAKLADLVPDYLPEVPKDPVGGGEFAYRVTPTGYELHSAGIDAATRKPIAVDDPR
jgi:hypothetical protein